MNDKLSKIGFVNLILGCLILEIARACVVGYKERLRLLFLITCLSVLFYYEMGTDGANFHVINNAFVVFIQYSITVNTIRLPR